MANETGQSSSGPDSRATVNGLGVLEALVTHRPVGRTMDVGTEGMSAAPESNISKGGGSILGSQATRGSQIPVPSLSTPVQVSAVTSGGQATPGSQIPMPSPSTPAQAPAVTPIPPGLYCGPHQTFDWHYTEGLGIGNSYEWMIRIALYPDRTCQVVFVIQHVYAPNPCVLLNVWDYFGTFVVNGQQLDFTL